MKEHIHVCLLCYGVFSVLTRVFLLHDPIELSGTIVYIPQHQSIGWGTLEFVRNSTALIFVTWQQCHFNILFGDSSVSSRYHNTGNVAAHFVQESITSNGNGITNCRPVTTETAISRQFERTVINHRCWIARPSILTFECCFLQCANGVGMLGPLLFSLAAPVGSTQMYEIVGAHQRLQYVIGRFRIKGLSMCAVLNLPLVPGLQWIKENPAAAVFPLRAWYGKRIAVGFGGDIQRGVKGWGGKKGAIHDAHVKGQHAVQNVHQLLQIAVQRQLLGLTLVFAGYGGH
mmetsp:Transcript_8729/g.11004  ORF Transcript_8729/g.11004 Transcript_8729/m.11004 type:complete len:287 (-) Transcript_8729:520-1380(-)